MKDKRVRYFIKIAILVAVYFTTARIGLRLNAVSGFATLVWAPTGIALTAIFVLGYRFWPAITLAAFLVNIATGASPLVALGLAAGNTAEALLGVYLLKRFTRFQPSMERVNDVLGLVAYAALASTAVSATIGVSALLLGGVVHGSTYGATWLAWWVGDMLGDLVVAPLLLVWSARPRIAVRPGLLASVSILAALLVSASVFVFHGFGTRPFTSAYILFPVLIWIALRFGQRGSVAATFSVSLIAVWGTVAGAGVVSNSSLSHNLLLLQSFMGVSAVTFMTMAAVVAERAHTQKRQLQLEHRTKLLTKQRAHLVALNQSKDEFIALASHQLRTPATAVKQYTGMLLENRIGKLTTAQRDMLRIAYENNERQLQVTNDLLNVAQIDTGHVTLQKEKVDLRALISDILEAQASTFAARNQVADFTHVRAKCIVYVDKVKIGMVLENIISNASKYSLPNKKIEIKLSKSKNELIISVRDEGVGIAKEDQAKLFKKFSRIDNSQSIAVGGLGLGLYWAKKIIVLHGGSIAVSSKPGHGSTFTVVLPVGGAKNS